MRLKRMVASVLFSLSLTAITTPSFANGNQIHVVVDNHDINFDNAPVVQNGNTLVEFRPIFEALGLKVTWDDTDQQVIGEKRGLQIVLTIGSNFALVNGQEKQLNVAPQIINGRTLIPIRFVGESSNEKVSWNGGTQTVTLSSNMVDSTYSLPIFFNGNELPKSTNVSWQPREMNNILFVSWKTLYDTIGQSNVKFDANNFTGCDISYGGKEVMILPDNGNINNNTLTTYNGTSYFPLQFVIESLGGTYTEDGAGVHITLN